MKTIPFEYNNISTLDSIQNAETSLKNMLRRRSIRDYSSTEIPKEVIETILLEAGSAPSGANMQPWTFCVVTNIELKSKIRTAAEQEEKLSYSERMSEEWLEDLAHLGTDWRKPFLEEAPVLIIVFKQSYGVKADGSKKKHYYVNESVGIASGFLIQAIHKAGLVTLTHTPSPMGFLSDLLNRPMNEKPFLLLPVGYPKENTSVPDIQKKSLSDIVEWYL